MNDKGVKLLKIIAESYASLATVSCHDYVTSRIYFKKIADTLHPDRNKWAVEQLAGFYDAEIDKMLMWNELADIPLPVVTTYIDNVKRKQFI